MEIFRGLRSLFKHDVKTNAHLNSRGEEGVVGGKGTEEVVNRSEREGIVERNAKAHLTLEHITDRKVTEEAEIIDGERVLFLGEGPTTIGVISLCRFRDVRRINTDGIALNPPPTERLVMRIQEESGSDFRLSDSPDDIYRESFYEAVAEFSDGSGDSRDVPQSTDPSVYILGDTLIPSHGIHEKDWEDINRIIDMVRVNEERVKGFFDQDSVRELLRRMELIIERGPDTNQPIGRPNTTSVALRFG